MPLFNPEAPRILRLVQPAVVATSVTTTEVVIGTLTIPGGSIGTTGQMEIDAALLLTSSANLKTVRVRLGGLGGTAIWSLGSINTNSNFFIKAILAANASQSAQFTWGFGHRTSDTLQLGATPVSSAVDLSADTTLVITGQAAAVTENMSCLAFIAKIYR